MAVQTVAIIGGGFSGTLLALHLLRAGPHMRVALVERDKGFGRGLAFSSGNPSHLLNVPAGRMSAYTGDPGHFLRWLQAQDPATEAGSFVPRRLFGAYVRQLLHDELKHAGDRLDLQRADVQALEAGADGVTLHAGERRIAANAAVLATGNFPPAPPPVADPAFYDSPLYRPDPWAPDALAGLHPQAPVLLIGTGLTTVDTVVSLLDQGHEGPIHALSRRGLLPQRHAAGVTPEPAGELPRALVPLVRVVRARAKAAVAAGRPWHGVVDGLRPVTTALWQGFAPSDRERFLRHLRPWWDVHRHRMAPAVADRIAAARLSGQLRIHAGRIGRYAAGDGVEVCFRTRGAGAPASLRAARVVNCSGPGADFARATDPLLQSLLASGAARPDPLRLGLDVSPACAVRDARGVETPGLYAVGPLTKAAFWESTAVPDIRVQCEQLAGRLAS